MLDLAVLDVSNYPGNETEIMQILELQSVPWLTHQTYEGGDDRLRAESPAWFTEGLFALE